MSIQALQKLYLNSAKFENEPAVHFKRWYSYKEFANLVDQAAIFLQKNGYQKNQSVPLYFDPSIEALVLIYACLKIGAYYVPFNSAQPSSLIQDLLANLDNQKVICLPKDIVLFTSCIGFEIDNLQKTAAHEKSEDSSSFQDGDFAYQLYTSGTTGKPKGILITSENLNYITQAMDQCFPCGKQDTLLWTTSWTFDVSIIQLFGFVNQGGKLVIPDTNTLRTHSLIPSYVKQFSITHLNLVPTLLSNLLKVWTGDDLEILNSHIKYFLIAGEKFNKDLALLAKKSFPKCNILNLYGPTEATVYASFYKITGQEALDIPIGKALPGSELKVFSADLQSCKENEVGEIYICGKGLSPGYCNNPSLTSQYFFNIEGTKYYKTGDYGKLNSSGDIEYLYRKDRQIKIHGMRLELSEIENKLSAFFNLPQQVHALFDGKQLHIFYIGDKSLQQKLSEHLKTNLPNYAQPSSFNSLSEFPTNASGKLDEKALYAILKK